MAVRKLFYSCQRGNWSWLEGCPESWTKYFYPFSCLPWCMLLRNLLIHNWVSPFMACIFVLLFEISVSVGWLTREQSRSLLGGTIFSLHGTVLNSLSDHYEYHQPIDTIRILSPCFKSNHTEVTLQFCENPPSNCWEEGKREGKIFYYYG